MKKVLLSIAVAMFAAAGFAQNAVWKSSIASFDAAEAYEYENSPAAMDKDGNLYVTGVQTQDFKFAGNDVKVLALGAYIAKYDAAGKELFAFALQGSIAITAITTDADNNLYIAGKFADTAYVTDVEGENKEIKSAEPDSQSAAFIAKYDANGKLLSVKSYEAVHNLPDSGMEFWGSPASVCVEKLISEGTKVYAQFSYNASVAITEDLTLNAKYSEYFGMAYMDVLSSSIVSFNNDLNSSVKIAEFTSADGASAITKVSPNFIVDGENVYIATFASGDVAFITSDKTEVFNFAFNDIDYTNEKGLILAKVGSETKTVKFSGAMNDEYNLFYFVENMKVINGKLYMGGTFQASLPFDSKVSSVGKTDLFVASFDAAELTLDWTYANAYDEGDVNKYFESVYVIFGKENIQTISVVCDMNDPKLLGAKNYEVSLTGEGKEYVGDVATAVAYNDNYIALINCSDKTYINVYNADGFATGINEVVIESENNAVYDLTGRRIEQIVKPGIYIVNGVKKLVK